MTTKEKEELKELQKEKGKVVDEDWEREIEWEAIIAEASTIAIQGKE